MERRNFFISLIVWLVGSIIIIYSLMFTINTIYTHNNINDYYNRIKNTYTQTTGTIIEVRRNGGPDDGKYRIKIKFNTPKIKLKSYEFATDEEGHYEGEIIDVWYSIGEMENYDFYTPISFSTSYNKKMVKNNLFFMAVLAIFTIISIVFMKKFNILKYRKVDKLHKI